MAEKQQKENMNLHARYVNRDQELNAIMQNSNSAIALCIAFRCISCSCEIPNAFENRRNLHVVLVQQACPDDLKGFVTELLRSPVNLFENSIISFIP